MNINDIIAYPIQCNVQTAFTSATGWRKTRGTVLVEVTGEDGLSGWGETVGPLRTVATAIEEDLKPLLKGQNILDTGLIWERMQVRRTKGIPPGAIGGVDTALWDLKGKILGAPVCRLMGGRFHKTIQPYGTALFYHEEDWDQLTALEEETQELLKRGFKAIKMKIGFGISRDIRRITRVREIVGDDFPLMVDANQSYNFQAALEVGRALDDLGVKWFEEPMAWLSLPAYRELGNRLKTPIAGGEVETSLMGFFESIRQGAVQIVQPDPALCGGITPALHVASVAKAFEVAFMPHVFDGIIGLSAGLHLTAGVSHYADWSLVPRPVILEWDATENPMRDKIVISGPELKDGLVDVPDTPGLGIELDRDAIHAFIIS